MNLAVDITIIGAGIAGVSAGARLAKNKTVAIVDMESAPAYHSTGRSAAAFAPSYGSPLIRKLTKQCQDFYYSPPDRFSDVDLLRPRPCLHFAVEGQEKELAEAKTELGSTTDPVRPEQVIELLPCLKDANFIDGLVSRDGGDLDVDAIMQGFLKQFKANGGKLICDYQVTDLERTGNAWNISGPAGTISTEIIINAAGAWADEVAILAGASPIGLQPMRRTALLVDPAPVEISPSAPLAVSIDESVYFKPSSDLLLLSPADETPCRPYDAQAEEIDIAIAIDRFLSLTKLTSLKLKSKWAGLRSFTPDRNPVLGFDQSVEGFFWMAGLGGTGIQTAPAMAELTGSLVLNQLIEGQEELLFAMRPDRFVT